MSVSIDRFFERLSYATGRVVVRQAHDRPNPIAGIGFSAAINDFSGVEALIDPPGEHCLGVTLASEGPLHNEMAGRRRRVRPIPGAFNLLPADEGAWWDTTRASYLGLCVHFERGAIDAWLDGAGPGRTLRPALNEPDSDIRRLGDAIAREIAAPSPAGGLYVEGLVLQLAAVVARRASDRGLPAPERAGLAAREVRALEEMMADRLAEGVSLDDLAAHVGRSRYHFARAFKRATGLSPHAFQTRLRIERVRALLVGTSAPLAQIALDCGFASQSHMTEAFTRAVGLPPGAFRRRFRVPERDEA